jgi:hypothetical protein
MSTLDRKENSLQDRIYIQSGEIMNQSSYFCYDSRLYTFFSLIWKERNIFFQFRQYISHKSTHKHSYIATYRIRDNVDRDCVCMYERKRQRDHETERQGENVCKRKEILEFFLPSKIKEKYFWRLT